MRATERTLWLAALLLGASATAVVACSSGAREGAAGAPPSDGGGGAAVPGPARLSETGLYVDTAARTLAPEVLAYAPAFEFWADGAEKSRWLFLPAGTAIDTSDVDHWVFPVGTKAWKELRANGRPIETRLLMKVGERAGDWWQMAYLWDEDGRDARAIPDGADDVSGTTHDVPSTIDCQNCHLDVRDVLIGVSALQLASRGSSAGAAKEPAVEALVRRGWLSHALPPELDVPGEGAVREALGYLHGNCGHCHNDEARRLAEQSRLRLRLLAAQRTPEVTGLYTTTIGTRMAHTLPGVTDVVVPGEPSQSGLWARMARRDAFAMPPLATEEVDEAGLRIVADWIRTLPRPR